MRHSNSGRKLSRTPSHRKALLHNLAKALLIHGKIRTTEMKAKELRSIVEPLITLGKRNDLHSRRLAYRVLNDHALVKRLFDEIAPLYKDIAGGYTRIEKFAMPRKGDNAPMALIELTQRADAPKSEGKAPAENASAASSETKSEAAAPEKPKKAAAKKSKEEVASADAEEPAKPKRGRKPKAQAEASDEAGK